jgi:hypothetical protein
LQKLPAAYTWHKEGFTSTQLIGAFVVEEVVDTVLVVVVVVAILVWQITPVNPNEQVQYAMKKKEINF